MNLDKLIDQWIGEDFPTHSPRTGRIFRMAEVRNKVKQDLKSRKQELIEGIRNLELSNVEFEVMPEISKNGKYLKVGNKYYRVEDGELKELTNQNEQLRYTVR